MFDSHSDFCSLSLCASLAIFFASTQTPASRAPIFTESLILKVAYVLRFAMKNTQNAEPSWVEPIRDLDEIKQELDKWQALGSQAKVWDYGASFSRLTIRIEKVGHPHNLIITCRGTLSICGSLAWDNAALSISHKSISSIFERKPVSTSWLVLRDDSAGFEVVCGEIFAQRDVEPIYWTDDEDDTE